MTTADPQSFNRYSYVNNDPVNLTDPLGLMAGANLSWGGVAGDFWGSSVSFNDPHFGGPGIIAEREAQYDVAMNDMAMARYANWLGSQGRGDEARDFIASNDNLEVEGEGEGETGQLASTNELSPTFAAPLAFHLADPEAPFFGKEN